MLLLASAIKIVREYERAIVFRLGRLLPEPKGPGLFLRIPIVDQIIKVDLRTITLMIPPQEVITKDNVPVRVNAVAYFRILDPKAAIVQVENFMVATSQVAQTTLRSVLGQHVLDELLSEREKINAILQGIIDEATAPWGIKVSIVEVKDVEIPSDMQRAMARQAEAERERRAKVINAEGEFQAAERLKDAALVIADHPIALQLRYLQTLLEIGADQLVDDRLPGPDRAAATLPETGRWRRRRNRRTDDGTLGGDRAPPGSALRPSRRRRPRTVEAAGRVPALPARGDAGGARVLPVLRGPRGAHTAGDAAPPAGAAPWQVRVVPNLYPAFEGQEVVVHTPRHCHFLAELTDDEIAVVAEAWQSRARRRGRLPARVRERALEAGASLPHTHSQLVWFRGGAARRSTGAPAGLVPASATRRAARARDRGTRRRRPASGLGRTHALRAPRRAADTRRPLAKRPPRRRAAARRRGAPPPAPARRAVPDEPLAPRVGPLAHRGRAAPDRLAGSSSAPATS